MDRNFSSCTTFDIVQTIYNILLQQQQQQQQQHQQQSEQEKVNMKYDETMKKSELLLSSSISTDLLHVALESSGGPNDTRRHYNNDTDPKEYFHLIQFLVERCCVIDEPSSLSVLLSKTCTFTEAKIQKQYTPLGHALSNRRVCLVRYCTIFMFHLSRGH